MNPLSFLIQNFNQVILDNNHPAFTQNINPKSNQKQELRDRKTNHNEHKDSVQIKIKRKISPKRLQRNIQLQKNLKDNQQTQKSDQQFISNSGTSNKPQKSTFNLNELRSQIQNLELCQVKLHNICSQKLNQINKQLNKKNSQYDIKEQEIHQIKSEINSTKKDIASLIKMLSNRKLRMNSPQRESRQTKKDDLKGTNVYNMRVIEEAPRRLIK